jgi:C4-dicarboxylate transporter DctM subunit
MSPVSTGIVGILLMVFLIALRMPIAAAMAISGFIGSLYLVGREPALAVIGMIPYSTASNYMLTVIPMFILMGQVMSVCGITGLLFSAAYRWFGWIRGGLAMATVASCALFAAACGSSVATAAAIGSIAIPEMDRYHYKGKYSAGVVAAGGTLGILIPPSTSFIVYGIITEQSIGKLFIAGIVPGIILASLYAIVALAWAKWDPEAAPSSPAKFGWRDRLTAAKSIWPILALVWIVLGGIYFGWFTPTEAGAVGAVGSFALAASNRKLTWKNVIIPLIDTGRMTCFIFLIVIGAMIFQHFLAVSHLPSEMSKWISDLQINRYGVIAVILIFLAITGCFVDALSMLLLTTPILYPIVLALGFDPIWFGVIMTICCEMGLITPPVGMNVYVIAGVAKNVPMAEIFAGVIPYIIAQIVILIILIVFPEVALFLPNKM